MAPFDAAFVPLHDTADLPLPVVRKAALPAAPRRKAAARARAGCPLTARGGVAAADSCRATSCCGCPLLVDWM